jgi:preprotein translocase subunit SecF
MVCLIGFGCSTNSRRRVVAESDKAEFEQPDVEELRKAYHHQSRWSRIGEFLGNVVTSRTTWTVVLALLIIAVLVFGFLTVS